MQLNQRGTNAQKAQALLNGTVTVTCTAIPDLDGSYKIDPTTQQRITGYASAINAQLGLPSGEDTFNWPDANGDPHPWPAPQFIEFAKKVMQFIYQCEQVIAQRSADLPSPQITLD